MNKTIKQITISGVLTAIAILMGIFLHFPIFGGELYLIGIATFLFPLFLRLDFAIITTTISVVIADVLTGYGHYSWMSFLAYGAATIILWVFSRLKFKFVYMLGAFVAALAIIAIYFWLEYLTFDLSFALKDLASTSLEMSIVLITTSLLYFPAKIIAKPLV